ncbi:hypothetical protein H9P43_002741 [Blastocladiella emersonii ATCC 22665]|nr:hypothetical protein H9P43_002741 [Blastocladiella emersonii ATCC 22665]
MDIPKLTPRQLVAGTALLSSAATAAVMLATTAHRRQRRRARLRSALEDEWDAHASDVARTATASAVATPIAIDESLVREQLARHYAFLGDAGMAKVRRARVVVVGVGGVGSHAAHMLARAGIDTIRVIDFDQVTLSSLNRHAVATAADVGTPKVATMARRLTAVAPHVRIDAVNRLFEAAAAEELLLFHDAATGEVSHPDYVLDCIDHLPTKAALIAFCVQRNIPVIASMGSGAKADPSRVFVADIAETSEDPLARAVRGLLRRQYRIESGVSVVYSTERATPGLGLIQPGIGGANAGSAEAAAAAPADDAAEFAPLPTFRASILPVLGPLPALFGNALAAHVLTHVAGWPTTPLPSTRPKSRDYAKLARELAKDLETHGVAPAGHGAAQTLLHSMDVATAVEDVWAMRSPISRRVDKLVLVPWRPDQPADLANTVAVTKEEATAHWRAFAAARDAGTVAGGKWIEQAYPDAEVRKRVEAGLARARAWSAL